MTINNYEILGLKPGAMDAEIKKAYRSLSLVHHPDKGGNAAEFIKITGAYERLLNKPRMQFQKPNLSPEEKAKEEAEIKELAELDEWFKAQANNILKQIISDLQAHDHKAEIADLFNKKFHEICSDRNTTRTVEQRRSYYNDRVRELRAEIIGDYIKKYAPISQASGGTYKHGMFISIPLYDAISKDDAKAFAEKHGYKLDDNSIERKMTFSKEDHAITVTNRAVSSQTLNPHALDNVMDLYLLSIKESTPRNNRVACRDSKIQEQLEKRMAICLAKMGRLSDTINNVPVKAVLKKVTRSEIKAEHEKMQQSFMGGKQDELEQDRHSYRMR